MEMIRTTYCIKLVRLCLWPFLLLFFYITAAQSQVNKYTVKNGKMYIELNKKINDLVLDSFITRYNLTDLPLKQFIKSNSADSLKKLGWKVETNNMEMLVISKMLFSLNNINNPSQKIIFTQKHRGNTGDLFPEDLGNMIYGFNRFKNKYPFAVSGSSVTFYLKNNTTAKQVLLAGSFTNWQTDALAMKRTDSGWIASVNLESGKYWYKFIIDGNWNIDNDNILRENDGRGNINSVFYKPNYVFKLDGFLNAGKIYVSGSFNNWRQDELMMSKSGTGWQLKLYLAEGTYTYKFIADGEWITDPKNKNRLPDGHNNYNSVIQFGKPYLFKLTGYTNAKQVTLTGSFNNWHGDELYMIRTTTGWELPYSLGSGNYEYKFFVDGKQVTDSENPLITSDVKNKANSFLVIDPNYTFRLKAFGNAKTIFLAGDFNNWKPYTIPMKHEANIWSANVNLPPGKHLYKFIVDGKWIIDPDNKLWEQNEYGNGNSILWIENNF